MKLPWLEKTFSRIEKALVYSLLVFMMVTTTLSEFLEPAKNLFTVGKELLLLSIVLLLIFRYVDDRFASLNISWSPRVFDDFNSGIQELLGKTQHTDQIDFFGSTGALFQPALWSRRIGVKKMRVLVMNPMSISKHAFPTANTDKGALQERILSRAQDWVALKESGLVEEIAVKVYDFPPTLFAVIVDRKKGLWGFLKSDPLYPYYHVVQAHLLTGENDYERSILNSLSNWFDNVFEHHADCIPIAPSKNST